MLLSTYYKRLKGLQLLIGSMNMMYLRIPKRPEQEHITNALRTII